MRDSFLLLVPREVRRAEVSKNLGKEPTCTLLPGPLAVEHYRPRTAWVACRHNVAGQPGALSPVAAPSFLVLRNSKADAVESIRPAIRLSLCASWGCSSPALSLDQGGPVVWVSEAHNYRGRGQHPRFDDLELLHLTRAMSRLPLLSLRPLFLFPIPLPYLLHHYLRA